MLFVPPCINKYYILDLQPENSLIRYTVEQGHRVFVMSWRNPDESMARLGWDDYIEQGPIKAIEVVRRHHRPARVQHAGLLRRRHDDRHRVGGAGRARRASGALADAADHAAGLQAHRRARRLRRRAHGADARGDDRRRRRPTAPACSRARNWPPPSASCARTTWCGTMWSATTSRAKRRHRSTCCTGTATRTNLPGPMYCWYLRHTYLQNDLREPGKLTVCGEKVDLGASRCRPTSMARAKTTSCRGRRPTSRPASSRASAASCSAPRATSPA